MSQFKNRVDHLLNTPALPVIAVIIGQIFWGCSFMFTRTAMRYADPNVLLSIRFVIAFTLLSLTMVTGKNKINLRKKGVIGLLALAVIEPLYFVFETYGIYYSNATYAGVVLSMAPIAAMALGAIFIKEYPHRRQVLFSFLPIAGVIFITVSGSSLGYARPIGILFLVITCLLNASYRTVNRKASESFTTFERTYVVMVTCTVFFTILAMRTVNWNISTYLAPLKEPGFILPVLALSVFGSVISNMLVNYGAGKMSIAKLSALATIQTCCSMFGGVIFLGEPITLTSMLGSVLILIGIWQITVVKNGQD